VTPLAVLAQAEQLQLPDITWGAISPELVLFGVGIIALLLDTAGGNRLQASFLVAGVLIAGSIYVYTQTDQFLLPGFVGLGGFTQFALTFIWRDRPRMLSALLTGLGFLAAIGVTAWQWATYQGNLIAVDSGEPLVGTASVIGDMVAVDGVALFTRIIVCTAGLLAVPLGFAYAEERRMHRGEYYPLLLFAATGMTLLASAADLIMVFIAYEVLSLALYILCAFARRDLNSQESALKYFLLGAFSSAIMLYGIAVTYGVAGTTNIAAAGAVFSSLDAPRGLTLAALGLLFVGFAFKTSLVPFHMWTPDVYQGAPTPVTGFMSAATKAAAFAAFVRIFVGAFGGLQWSWAPVFWVIAVITMIAGAILTVVQTDLKRMLAYSTVAHAGYILIGLMSVSQDGVSSLLLYLFIYTFMTVGSFGVLALFERRRRKAMALDDLRGVGRRYPVPAGMMGLFLLSLAGIPGTAGFIAKFAVFRAAIDAGFWVLVVVAVVSSLISAFAYIRVIVSMFMDPEPEPPIWEGSVLVPSTGVSAGLIITSAAVVVLGIVPGVLIELTRQAATFAG
jgi:NADH-quinone oxidoreductase subunit N